MTDSRPPFPSLDLTTDSFTDEERTAFFAWYAETHGEGGKDLTPFVRFMVEHDPGSFKRFRRFAQSMIAWPGEDMLPRAASPLTWLSHYFRIGNGPGAAYEVIAARSFGASKELVADALCLAAAISGPMGWNGAASHLGRCLDEWTGDEPDSMTWPSGWGADPDAFKSGIDLSDESLSDEEMAHLEAWYRRVCGEVPSGVTVLAEHNPAGLKAYRNRIERAFGRVIPVQMGVLLLLHAAAMGSSAGRVRRARHAARYFGVDEKYVVEIVGWATINTPLSTLSDVFDD